MSDMKYADVETHWFKSLTWINETFYIQYRRCFLSVAKIFSVLDENSMRTNKNKSICLDLNPFRVKYSGWNERLASNHCYQSSIFLSLVFFFLWHIYIYIRFRPWWQAFGNLLICGSDPSGPGVEEPRARLLQLLCVLGVLVWHKCKTYLV